MISKYSFGRLISGLGLWLLVDMFCGGNCYDKFYKISTALDLTQDIFIVALQAISSYKKELAGFWTWLYRIATEHHLKWTVIMRCNILKIRDIVLWPMNLLLGEAVSEFFLKKRNLMVLLRGWGNYRKKKKSQIAFWFVHEDN